MAGFCKLMKFAHPVTLEPEVTGGWYSGLWTLVGCSLCVLSMKKIGSDSFFECVISHGMTLLHPDKKRDGKITEGWWVQKVADFN